MDIVTVFFASLALSMDAFAASLCLGMSVHTLKMRHLLSAGACFGAFQAAMPLIGYALGASFYRYAAAFDHWIAFLLLGGIGLHMIREALKGDVREVRENAFGLRELALSALASSMDALAVGITLAVSGEGGILRAALLIGAVTFLLSAAGVRAGHAFGGRLSGKTELFAGAVLIVIGAKILIEHIRAAC